VRTLGAAPHVKRMLSILNVPLLRNAPSFGFPVPVWLATDAGALNPKVNLEKAKAELLQHTQARGNLIAGEQGEDLSILVFLDVPEDLPRLEPERNRLLGSARTAETAKQLAGIEGPYQAAIQETNRSRNEFIDAIRKIGLDLRPRLDDPVRLSGLPLINVVLREHIKLDIRTFGIVALSVFTATFLVIYRRARWVAFPILSCILPVVLMLGLMVLLNYKVTVITSNMPVLLFVLTLPYTVYFIERYLERSATNPAEDPVATSTTAPLEI